MEKWKERGREGWEIDDRRQREIQEGGVGGSQNKGGEAGAKMDDGSKKRHPSGDGGVIERQLQIKPHAERIWMMKPGV